MHLELRFISTVAVAGLFLTVSVIVNAQEQITADDKTAEDDSDNLAESEALKEGSEASGQQQDPPTELADDQAEGQMQSEVETNIQESSQNDDALDIEEQRQKQDGKLEIEANAEVESEVSPGQIALDLGAYYRYDSDATTFALAPILSLWFEITDAIDLMLEVGCAFAAQSTENGKDHTHFYLGNPFLGIRRAYRADRTHFHFGFGFTVPLSQMELPADEFEILTYRIASAMRGRWNHWLWMPEHVALVIPIGARMISEENILFGAEMGLAVLVPTGDYHDHRGDFYAQGAGLLGFGFERVETGLRLQAVLVPMIPYEDKFQSSIGPFVKLILDGGSLGANIMVNLDEDDGVFGEADRWGLNLNGVVDF
ncbi:MAG: hypothetical protein JXA30_15590 [Deltaproteobacteria bacterium]|nr:hypothetical protein [Deltaproteobacteria bacterium]